MRALAATTLLLAGQLAAAAPDPLEPGLAPAVVTDPARYPANVWVTGSMAKVRRTDPPGPVHWALLSSARNEAESFQVHLRAPAGGLAGVTVEPSDLVDARSGCAHLRSHRVSVSRALYQGVLPALRSDANGLSGEIPDALVPARDRYWGETRNAFPADRARRREPLRLGGRPRPPGHPLRLVPGQRRRPVGRSLLATLPVRLKVWNFDLPSTASLATHFAMSWNGACVQEFGSYDAPPSHRTPAWNSSTCSTRPSASTGGSPSPT